MRVRIVRHGKTHFGEYLGLMTSSELGGCDRCAGDSFMAVIRADGFGMMLMLVHPSDVHQTTPQEEEDR